MNNFIADTMALVLRLEKRRMPMKVKQLFIDAEDGKIEIFIPSMVLSELAYLSEKNRIETSIEEALTYINEFPGIKASSMTSIHVQKAFEISDIPELHDRLIAAHGLKISAPILTNDPIMHKSSSIKCIWQ